MNKEYKYTLIFVLLCATAFALGFYVGWNNFFMTR